MRMCIWRARIASKVGQTAKARSGYRVQSLRKGRDRQCSHNLARMAVLLQSRKSCRNLP
jgi:hypothetical protein